MLCEIDASTKHASNVGMAFIKAFLHDCINKRRPMKQHPFIALVMIFLCDFAAPMRVPLPKLDISDLLNLDDMIADKNASRVALISMFTYG